MPASLHRYLAWAPYCLFCSCDTNASVQYRPFPRASPAGTAHLKRSANPILDYSIYLKERTEQFRAKAFENERSCREVASFVGQQYAHWKHVPSISPTTGRYASAFGSRIHPITGVGRMHNGVDISNSKWTPIFATADGVVTISRFSESFGNYVVVDHGNGFVTKYAHMQSSSVKA